MLLKDSEDLDDETLMSWESQSRIFEYEETQNFVVQLRDRTHFSKSW